MDHVVTWPEAFQVLAWRLLWLLDFVFISIFCLEENENQISHIFRYSLFNDAV